MKERIKNLCKQNGISMNRLEDKLGFGKGYISKLGTTTPNTQKIQLIADYFGVSVDYILTGKVQALADYFGIDRTDLIDEKDDMIKPIRRGVSIPVLERVAAGIPIDAIEEIIDTEEISEALANTGKFFGLRLQGNSMEPRMCDGDIVIVRAQNDAESGDIVIVIVNGDDACCKRLIKNREGITLQSFNPNYEPMYFSNQEILDKPVAIIGKVIELRGKF